MNSPVNNIPNHSSPPLSDVIQSLQQLLTRVGSQNLVILFESNGSNVSLTVTKNNLTWSRKNLTGTETFLFTFATNTLEHNGTLEPTPFNQTFQQNLAELANHIQHDTVKLLKK